MYIRRKVFSRFIDEYGDERLFSTTDYEYDDYGYGQRMYASYLDEAGNLVSEDGHIMNTREQREKAEDLFGKGKKGPETYKSGTANGARGKSYKSGGYLDWSKKDKEGAPTWSDGRLVERERKGLTEDEMKALKKKVGKRTDSMKNWNKTDEYKQQLYEARKKAADTKRALGESRELKNQLGKAKAMNKGLLIGLGAAGAGAAGYGIYRAVKARKAKKEEKE